MAEEQTVEEKAKSMGWIPKEEFKGDPEKHRSAEDFVERGENYVPILKDRVKKLETDLETALKVTKAELEKVRKQGYEEAKEKYEAKKAELANEELEAVESQDVEKFKEIQTRKESLKEPEPVVEQQVNPVFSDWNKKNAWYGTDTDLTNEADAQFDTLLKIQQAKDPNKVVPPESLYSEIEKRVKMLYPEKFENPHRKEPAEVETGTEQPGEKSNSWSDLPPAAKSAYERQRRYQKEQGREFTKEQYLAIYNEE